MKTCPRHTDPLSRQYATSSRWPRLSRQSTWSKPVPPSVKPSTSSFAATTSSTRPRLDTPVPASTARIYRLSGVRMFASYREACVLLFSFCSFLFSSFSFLSLFFFFLLFSFLFLVLCFSFSSNHAAANTYSARQMPPKHPSSSHMNSSMPSRSMFSSPSNPRTLHPRFLPLPGHMP